ncbi:MAG: PAS domain S-box protein [Ferruginibacter sp.]
MKKQVAALSGTLQAYLSAFNEVAIVTITDLGGHIIYANDKFIEISQYSREELLGKTHQVVNSGHHPKDFFAEMWRTITSGKPWRGEIKNRAKDGSHYWVDTVITPVKDEYEKPFQFLSIRNLITKQKEHEASLAAYQQELIVKTEQLNNAQMVAKTGSWYITMPENTIQWSDETYRIFEIPPGSPMSFASFMEKVHPDDRETLEQQWASALKTGSYEMEHRIITPSGEKWVSERASIDIGPGANPSAVVGTVQDITEKKKNEHLLKQTVTLYRSLFNHSPYAAGLMDANTLQFLEVNETATKLYGYSREEFLQKTAFDMRLPEERAALKELHKSGSYTQNRTIRTHCKKNGDLILVEPAISEINYNGVKTFLVIINDLTEKIKAQEDLAAEKRNRQKAIDRAILEAEEKSRAGIGRELHDNINQLLVASTLFLKKTNPAAAKDAGLLNNGIQLVRNAIEEIRKLSSHVVPPSLNNLSLEESIEYLSKSIKLTGTAVKLEINLIEEQLGEAFKVNIYRIIQEQFSNIIKYAAATAVVVKINQQLQTLTLEITDNGRGFDMQQAVSGIGLANIRHRAETYNGEATISSSPGFGCQIFILFTTTPAGPGNL